MKKWFIAFTAGAVVIGCGGGSGLDGINNGNGGGGGGNGRTIPVVNLKPNAQVQFLYLSGQGRRSPGSQIAVMNNIRMFNSATDYWPKDMQGSGSPLRVQLDGYTLNQFVFDVPMAVGANPQTYTQFPLEIAQMDEEQGGQPVTVYSGPPFLVTTGDSQDGYFKMNLQVFPGRQTSIQVLLNDAMLTWDAQNGIQFNTAQFKLENYSQTTGAITGFLSDMVAFDVSALPAAQRPLLQNGERAEMVHFSGDLIGISGHFFTVSGREEAAYDNLSPIVIDSGVMTKPVVLGGNKAPGIFTVMEPNPIDPFGSDKINAIQGFYRDYTEVLSNLSDFGMIAMPSTRSKTAHQVVLFNRNSSGTITACWQGVADFTGPSKGVIRLYSLEQLPDAGAQPRATGEVFYTKTNGVVKSGTFAVSNVVGNAVFPFPKTGGFVVFR